jgi:light-regulated signal transduction histidine kinase (bacteriophytochrome)
MRQPRDDRLIGHPATMQGVTHLEGKEGPVEFYGRTTREPRVGAYRRLASAPLYVMVTTDRRVVLRPFMVNVGLRATLSAVLIAVSAALLVLFLRTTRRECENAARLAEANRELERRVRERTAALEAANSEMQSFGYSISHDLQAPLRHLSGYAGMLKEDHAGALDGEAAHLIDRISERADHMGQLVRALMELSRISSGDVERIDLDVSAMAGEIAHELRRAEPDRAVTVDIQPGLRAVADPTLVRTLLQNLLGNAFKYTRENPAAHVEVMRDPHDRRSPFVVRDNGAGFDPSQASRLFEPFQRLHAASQFEGHGIGLATSRRIVQRHGGRIWAESLPGQGATFFFTLG